MADSSNDPETAARGTLALLETRLRRLEFLLTGSSSDDGLLSPATKPSNADETVTSKLRYLERDVNGLKKLDGVAGSLVKDVDKLYSTCPELFSQTPLGEDPTPNSGDLSMEASVVISHASLYPETASRLSSLQTLNIPPAEQSTKLIELTPGLEQCHRKQEELQHQIQDLRQRSARCLEWWVRVGVVGMGDLWEEWEDRIGQAERTVTGQERRQNEQE